LNDTIAFVSTAVPEGRVFGLDSQTFTLIGMQLLNGVILAIALTFILYKPVKEFMRKRRESIQSDIDNAAAVQTQSNALIKEYSVKIESIQQERLDTLEAARQEAKDEGRLLLQESQAEADEIKKRARASIAEENKRLLEETRLKIIDLSSLIAQEHMAVSMDEEAQNQYFDQALAQLEEAQWRR